MAGLPLRQALPATSPKQGRSTCILQLQCVFYLHMLLMFCMFCFQSVLKLLVKC